jgi:hypothetical protein
MLLDNLDEGGNIPMISCYRGAVFALLAGVAVPAGAQSANDKWVPYSAHYKETIASKDTSGNVVRKQALSDQKRAEDGAMMTIVSKNGQTVSAKIWQSDGKKIDLDYGREQAFAAGQSPRKHLGIPAGTPIGADTVAGLRCSIYPVHMASGGGSICVDVTDDIMAKEELHFEAGGVHQDYSIELTSIDLMTPVNSSEFKIPNGFKSVTASPPDARKSSH